MNYLLHSILLFGLQYLLSAWQVRLKGHTHSLPLGSGGPGGDSWEEDVMVGEGWPEQRREEKSER